MPARSNAQWLAFPLILGGALAVAIALDPLIGAPAALGAAEIAGVLAIVWGEWRWPYLSQWSRSHGDVRTDFLHALGSGIGTTQLVRVLVQAGGVALAGALSRAFGAHLWPATWPLLGQLALALVIAEFGQYWLHRWQHERDALWRFHAVHHSAPRLYWLNAARFHPVDLGLLYIFGYLPLVALGCPETVIMRRPLNRRGLLSTNGQRLRLTKVNPQICRTPRAP